MTDTETLTRSTSIPAVVLTGLQSLLGERCSSSPAERAHHGRGESYHATMPPDLVCYAESTEEVSAIVTLCAAHDVKIIPFGAGTSLEGHISAPQGGVCVDLSRMKRIIAIRPDDLDATIQPGVTRQQLNSDLRDTGMFFPIDPGGESTLGGMAATRASGTNAVRYGTMRENVVNITAVMADGSIIRTGSRARKSSAGYDLTRLPECVSETQKDIDKASFFIAMVGHVGDGNFHLGLAIDPDSEAELAEAYEINDRVVRRAIALDGTCTGEHGVGSGKVKFMALEHGKAVDFMHAIKPALDPKGIFTPGKMLPPQLG